MAYDHSSEKYVGACVNALQGLDADLRKGDQAAYWRFTQRVTAATIYHGQEISDIIGRSAVHALTNQFTMARLYWTPQNGVDPEPKPYREPAAYSGPQLELQPMK